MRPMKKVNIDKLSTYKILLKYPKFGCTGVYPWCGVQNIYIFAFGEEKKIVVQTKGTQIAIK